MKKNLAYALTLLILGLALVGFLLIFPPTTVGSFPSHAAGERAALQLLSKEIRWRPWKATFRHNWQCRGESCGGLVRVIIYDRRMKTIGYEADPGSGYSHLWRCNSDEEIHAVARSNGTLDDFPQRLW